MLGAANPVVRTLRMRAYDPPGRSIAVRVMNVHKAKGLEAPVVILAFPTGEWQGAPTIHVERPSDGKAVGYIRVEERAEAFTMRTLAQPLDWPERAAAEAQYERAEDLRLLYVASTRAGEELIVNGAVLFLRIPRRRFRDLRRLERLVRDRHPLLRRRRRDQVVAARVPRTPP